MTTERDDWTGVFESIHRPSAGRGAWGRAVLDAVEKTVPRATSIAMVFLDHDSWSERVHWTAIMSRPRTEIRSGTEAMSQGTEHALFGPAPTLLTTKVVLATDLPPTAAAFIRSWQPRMGMEPCVGIVTHPSPGSAVVILVFCDDPISITAYERRTLRHVALHLDSAGRLRSHDESVRAMLTHDGRVIARGSTAPLESRHARGSFWASLVDGGMTLAPQGAGPLRQYAVLETPSELRPLRALSIIEQDVVALAARGLSNKLVAHEVGASLPHVSMSLAQAASKLGTPSRSELVRIAAMFPSTDGDARLDDTELTAAERDVLDLLRQGLSNQDIAIRRARSLRTIANQVASILRKTSSGSRRALVTRGSFARESEE